MIEEAFLQIREEEIDQTVLTGLGASKAENTLAV